MFLEQQVEALIQESEQLKARLDLIERRGAEEFVTPKVLAEKMGCAENTIRVKIRSGEIYATKKVGGYKIPMSQFYEKEIEGEKVMRMPHKNKKPKEQMTLKEKVFI